MSYVVLMAIMKSVLLFVCSKLLGLGREMMEQLFILQSLMSRYNVKGFPTILVFGADKDSPYPYEGARTASAIESYALEQLENNAPAPELTELTGPVSLITLLLFSCLIDGSC